MTRKQIVGYIATLLGVSWTAQALIRAFVGGPEAPGAAPLYLGVMFLPGALGLWYTIRDPNVRRSVPWKPAGFGALVTAVLLPMVMAFAILGVLAGAGLGRSEYFTLGPAGVTIASGPWVLRTGEQGWWHFVANIAVTAALYSILTGLVTVGEEYGWRGVLQNVLIREFGFARGVAFLGFVWGIWHVPIVLAGYNYPQTPVLGAFVLMPALLISASFIMAWLTLWNRSFWPAVLMHGVINSVYDSVVSRVSLTGDRMLMGDLVELGVFTGVAVVAYVAGGKMAQSTDAVGRQEISGPVPDTGQAVSS